MMMFRQLNLLCLLLSSTVAIKSPTATSSSRALQPWELASDPNPFDSIGDLQDSVSSEEIDNVLNRVVGTEGGIIIQRFKPQSGWLWKQWFGTVLFDASSRAVKNMMWALVFCVWCRLLTHGDWNILEIPSPEDHPFLKRLTLVGQIWKTLMSLTTFLLTFFVGQAYAFWRSVHDHGRGIQGRLNDINMLLATHSVTRQRRQRGGAASEFTNESAHFLDDIAQTLRVFHLLFWASNTKRFRILLTRKGMDRLVSQGYLSAAEQHRLEALDLPPTGKQWAVLESAILKCQKALRNPRLIKYSQAFEHLLLEQFLKLRAVSSSIADLVDGRMPLAYAHFVQILVDAFLVTAPIAQ